MMVSADHQRVINMLKESISLMCKSSLCFDIELSVEGLLGVTLDKKDIFLVSINELIQKNTPVEKRANQRSENSGCSMFKGEEDRERETCSPPLRKKRQRRRRSSQNSTGSDVQLEDARTTTADKRDSESLDIPGIKAEESGPQQNREEIVIKQEVDQDAFIDSDSFSGVADLESEMPYPMSLTRASGGVDLGDDMSMATSQNLQIPLMDPLPSTSTHRYYPPKRPCMQEALWSGGGGPNPGPGPPRTRSHFRCLLPREGKPELACGRCYTTREALTAHQERFHFRCLYSCVKCGFTHPTRKKLQVHFRQQHHSESEHIDDIARVTFDLLPGIALDYAPRKDLNWPYVQRHDRVMVDMRGRCFEPLPAVPQYLELEQEYVGSNDLRSASKSSLHPRCGLGAASVPVQAPQETEPSFAAHQLKKGDQS